MLALMRALAKSAVLTQNPLTTRVFKNHFTLLSGRPSSLRFHLLLIRRHVTVEEEILLLRFLYIPQRMSKWGLLHRPHRRRWLLDVGSWAVDRCFEARGGWAVVGRQRHWPRRCWPRRWQRRWPR